MIKRAMTGLAVVTMLAATPAVSAAAFTIHIGDGGVIARIGPWSMSTPNLRRAQQVFGAPSSKRAQLPGFAGAPAVADCAVAWSRLGLRVVFSTLGIEPGSCNPAKVIWTARITSNRWQTWHGLRVGARSSQVLRHHPWASAHDGVWWLASTVVPWGNQSRIPTVTATIRDGHISGFDLWVQAQGE